MNHIYINEETAYESVVYPNYFITESGKVYSIYVKGGQGSVDINHPHELSYGVDNYGYLRVVLSWCGEKKYIHVHTLVVEQFIGHIDEGLCVNHKDGNKQNNNVNNLEIVTVKENTVHAHANHLTSRECPVIVEHDGISEYFYSLTECMNKMPDLSRNYLSQIKNGIIQYSMIDFRKVDPNATRSAINAYYNGELFKTFANMRDASLYFGKSKGAVSVAISDSEYRKKVNKYHIVFPSVSTIENAATR